MKELLYNKEFFLFYLMFKDVRIDLFKDEYLIIIIF